MKIKTKKELELMSIEELKQLESDVDEYSNCIRVIWRYKKFSLSEDLD